MKHRLADYVATDMKKGDIKQYGRKGMRWGVITSKPSGKAASGGDAAAKALIQGTQEEPRQVVGAASGETSTDRYARLVAQSKGDASSLSDQDLKFVNARTEALGKIAKMNEKKPGFLEETVRKVAKQTFQNALQSAATAGANKLLENTLGITPKGKIKSKDKEPNAAADAAKKIVDAAAKTKTVTPANVTTAKTAAAETISKATSGLTPAQKVAALKAMPQIQPQVVPNDLFISIMSGLKR